MAETKSLADQSLEALSLVMSICDDIDNDDPERHILRNLKRLAEQNLETSFRLAIDIAHQAKQVRVDFAQALVERSTTN